MFQSSHSLFAGPPYGIGILTAGLILAIMVLSLHHLDFARRVRGGPPGVEGSGLRAGLHDLGSLARCRLPYARVGVIGGIMLGLGRALGETMAVTFVIGNAHRISAPSCSREQPSQRRSPTSLPRRSAISTRPPHCARPHPLCHHVFGARGGAPNAHAHGTPAGDLDHASAPPAAVAAPTKSPWPCALPPRPSDWPGSS